MRQFTFLFFIGILIALSSCRTDFETVASLNERSNEYDMIEIYQDTHMYDIQDYI